MELLCSYNKSNNGPTLPSTLYEYEHTVSINKINPVLSIRQIDNAGVADDKRDCSQRQILNGLRALKDVHFIQLVASKLQTADGSDVRINSTTEFARDEKSFVVRIPMWP